MQNTGSGGQIKFELTAGSGLAAMTCSGSELSETAMQGPLDELSVQSIFNALQCLSAGWSETASRIPMHEPDEARTSKRSQPDMGARSRMQGKDSIYGSQSTRGVIGLGILVLLALVVVC